MTTILLAGATGLVGGLALTALLADDRVDHVVALSRRPLAPRPKLVNPVVDFDALPDKTDYWAADGVIWALGTTRAKAGSAAAFRRIDHDYALAVAERARQAGATRMALTSSMGADAGSAFLYPRTKGQIEDAMTALDFPSLTIVRPSLLGGERDERRPAEAIAGRVMHLLQPLLPRKYRISPAATVAHMLVESVLAARPGVHIIEADRLVGDTRGRPITPCPSRHA